LEKSRLSAKQKRKNKGLLKFLRGICRVFEVEEEKEGGGIPLSFVGVV
jgi:hypothetical protein